MFWFISLKFSRFSWDFLAFSEIRSHELHSYKLKTIEFFGLYQLFFEAIISWYIVYIYV